MESTGHLRLPWFESLVEDAKQELSSLRDRRPHKVDLLESEREQLVKKRKGWSQSLADPELPHGVRVALQNDWAAAEVRVKEITSLLAEDSWLDSQEASLFDQQDVTERLHRLADVLAAHNPTRSNLELSKFIDRIDCWPSGKVTMRTCKLGLVPDVAAILAEQNQADYKVAAPDKEQTSTSLAKTGPRRRTRLRVLDSDGEDAGDLDASIEFATDTHRFAGLDDRWFWIDDFQVPKKEYWIDSNHEDVKRKYQEIKHETGKKPMLTQLASHFGVCAPWIRKALDLVTNAEGRLASDRRHKGGYTPPISLETKVEIVRRYQQGQSEKDIVRTLAVSRGRVTKTLDEWDLQRGETRQDGRRRRWKLETATENDIKSSTE